MATRSNDEDEGNEDHPSTWPWLLSSLSGFPFPDLTNCRALQVRRSASSNYPDLLLLHNRHGLPNGRGFYLGRRLVDSLFGAVFHGYKGICRDPQNPLSFEAPEGEDFQVAVKVSSLANMRRTPQENVFREISVMRHLSQARHPNVMPLVDACITRTHVFVVTPFYAGGDLLNWVVPSEGTGERRARRWFRQIFRGVHYMHEMGLCHHDLSPENVVVKGSGEVAVVMDMGMVQRIPRDAEGRVTTMRDQERFGKLRYMAPEIYLNEDYDGRKVDIWSLGVSLLVCLAGTYPWEAPTRVPVPTQRIYQSDVDRFRDLSGQGAEVMLNRMNLSPPRVSAEALDLVQSILIVDSSQRPFSAADLAEHPFCME